MKDEFALTILLSAPTQNEVTLKRIEHILKQPIDWYKVFRISILERTTFIVCKNILQYRYFWMVPDPLWIIWNASYIGNIKRNETFLLYYNLLKEKFLQETIVAIPSSGIMLLSTIYKDMVGVRLLHDLDFLTAKDNLSSISKILFDLNFKRIYINDRDLLINSHNINESDVLYSKYSDATYINCDFCFDQIANRLPFSYLINSLKDKKSDLYYVMQLIMLYLSAEKSWDGDYYTFNIRHYNYSRLIDIYLYKNNYIKPKMIKLFQETVKHFFLNETILNIDIVLNFFKEEGYLI